MAAPALTHHEILERAEPFVRHGLTVDLAASDRAARRIAFKPRPCAAIGGGETWSMDCRDVERLVVERRLHHPCGLEATLRAAGPQPAVLLARVDAIAPAHHFHIGAGYAIARSHEIRGEEATPTPASLFLEHAAVRLDGLMLQLRLPLPHLRSIAGDITLTPTQGTQLELPEDLLAVQGWDWARLVRKPEGWTSKLRLRGPALRRSRTAEAALDQVARHLAQKLDESPARFHERHRLARWGVVLRRSIPVLTALAMIGGGVAMVFFADRDNTGPWLALHYAPIALLAVAFSLQELSRFEIPPWPRRLLAPSWRLQE